jgi:hypothetical protein
MKLIRFALVAALLSAPLAFGQYGEADWGYFPSGYSGATFSGTVTQTTRNEITLSFTNAKKNKTDTFTGRLEAMCTSARNYGLTGGPLLASNIPNGSEMTAYYNQKTKKVDGKKIKENVIVAVWFHTWGAEKLSDVKSLEYCTLNSHLEKMDFRQTTY